MEHTKTNPRRRHSDELRTKVLSQCAQADASVAGIALAHGLNANLVHKWRRQARELQAPSARQTSARPEFIALALPTAQQAAPMQPDIHMELRRGAATMCIRWPVAAAPECTAWLREWLR
jgi:transposase